ncbi:MAG: ABC transporter ATP-binding protein [Alcaligenaceae bacterium]|nr:ABC transporter ATP-binding protein [Alcaligenaceae bacterium]
MAASVKLDRIEKYYGQKKILKNISLSIEEGEFVTLVGPSGCGKSTLLRTVAGLVEHDAGSLHIGNVDVTHTLPRDRDVAMVFQSYALYPHMTVEQNIATPLRMQRLSRGARLPLLGRLWPGSRKIRQGIKQDVEQVAAQVQLEQLLGSKPAQLSGGQRQRVAVARAMVRQPGVFLMDEPLSNLDARLRVHMRAEISTLHKRVGSTFIYVTHDQVEAMTLSDRVAVMMDGEIVQAGTPRELFEQPTDIRIAQFIGSPEINILSAQTDKEGKVWLGTQAIPMSLERYDTPVKIGMRPEYLKLCNIKNAYTRHGVRLEARLERTEILGHDAILFCKHLATNTPLTASVTVADIDAMRGKEGWPEKIVLEADLGQALWFDVRGKRIESPAGNVTQPAIRMIV